ncbi:hypothetical protein DB35_10220 [Streptomyces abyssalis]|uniref:DUF397 domain-containing protein n=1 Tax=Streptomyces abyssalis TaxID=933944 RepID=A0A1E7JI19_9ACTN|nr:DUF397 domain-containing protein [Streptomyces abyssalis]OEU86100.1 hypothetical protein AN215_27680 [Streptomyces abyssalis]OEU92433.1 hypothetical protein DB35_10220 [Streptomyces abyssalis]
MSTDEFTTGELSWFKSSYSDGEGGDCLEIAACPGTVHVRDSKVTFGPTLSFGADAWSSFVEFAV